MSVIINIDLLPHDIRKRVSSYLKKFIHIQGNNIVSIFIYGSATGRNYIPGESDVNIVAVLKGLEFADLKKTLKLVRWGIAKRIPVPLLLTIKHIQTSSDAFPIEFLEMKDNYYLLYGQDLFKDMPINESNIRLQCEQQLKGKLIRLRQAYLEAGLNIKRRDALLKESLNSLIPIFRGLLRIKTNQQPPTDKEEIINSLSRNFSINPGVFLQILQARKALRRISPQNIETIFENYIRQIQKLAIFIDQLIK